MGLVVNLIGGGGAGKSTMAAGIFYNLKMKGLCPELATEWVKEQCWAGYDSVVEDQLYIFAKQTRRINSPLRRGADVVITDSPIFMSLHYGTLNPDTLDEFFPLVLAEHHRHDSINVFVRRQKHYEPRGRWGTEDDAKDVDSALKALMDTHGIQYIELDGNELAPGIVATMVEEHLEKQNV